MEGKILVVEDDPITQHFYKLVFKHCSYNTVLTEDADEIFQFLSEGDVKLVILDINLRNTVYEGKIISGIELSRMIKENPRYGNPKIILVSAFSLSKNDDDYIESKADDFVLKPISDFNLFLSKIRNLINNE